MYNTKIKKFWIKKIRQLITDTGFDTDDFDDAFWDIDLKLKNTSLEVEIFAQGICIEILTKTGLPTPPDYDDLLTDAEWEEYEKAIWGNNAECEKKIARLVKVFREKIGVDPTNNERVDGSLNHGPLKWRKIIDDKIPTNFAGNPTIADIPNGIDLADLLYRHKLHLKIVDDVTGIPGIIKKGVRVNDYGFEFPYEVNDDFFTDFRNFFTLTDIAKVFELNGLDPNVDKISSGWSAQLAKKADLDTANATIATLTTERDDYKNQVDSHTCSDCSHSDYDTLKTENQTLKTENIQLKEHKCDCDNKVVQKEKEIINKIITDLELNTERERENTLEAVIAEIKAKITPPADSGKDTKIKELETQITSLKEPKNLKDLPISNGIKEEIVKMSKELGLSTQTFAKLENATSYQQLNTIQKEAFQEKLSDEVSRRKNAHYLNYVLGTLTIGSLIALAFVLWKMMKKDIEKSLPEKDKE